MRMSWSNTSEARADIAKLLAPNQAIIGNLIAVSWSTSRRSLLLCGLSRNRSFQRIEELKRRIAISDTRCYTRVVSLLCTRWLCATKVHVGHVPNVPNILRWLLWGILQ